MKETASVNSSFGTPMKTLHWATAVLVLIMLYGGFTMSRETATMHFGTGLVVLVAMVVWLAVRRASGKTGFMSIARILEPIPAAGGSIHLEGLDRWLQGRTL